MSPPPGAFVITFNLDPNVVALAGAGFLVAVGFAFMLGGLVGLRSNTLRPGFLAYARARTVGAAGMDDAALREALLTRRHAQAWGPIFGGAGIVVALGAWLGASWLTRGDFLLISVLHGWAPIISVLLSASWLLVAGQAYGVHRLRARSASLPVEPVEDEPRSLRLRGLAPRWYAPAYAASAALLWLAALIALPSVKAHPATELLGGEWLPLGRWIVLVAPVTALLEAALGMVLMRWVVAPPALRFSADARQSAAYDAGFRREWVLALAFQNALVLLSLTVLQAMTILDSLSLERVGVATLLLLPIFSTTIAGYVVLVATIGLSRQAHITGGRGPARVMSGAPAAPAPPAPDHPVS